MNRMPRRMMRPYGALCKHAWGSLPKTLLALCETSPSFPHPWVLGLAQVAVPGASLGRGSGTRTCRLRQPASATLTYAD